MRFKICSFSKLLIVFLLILYSTTALASPATDTKMSAKYSGVYKRVLPLAKAGRISAQYELGIMYEKGRGVSKNYKKAAEWYRKAALKGDASAQYKLATLYANGSGIPHNHKKAVNWYRKAIKNGHIIAKNNLGTLYQQGKGVRKSYKKALKLYHQAAKQGYATAQTNLGSMYAKGLGVTKSRRHAVAWYQKAALKGYSLGTKKLQYTLKKAGYKVGKVDGKYGKKTLAAVKKYFRDKKRPNLALKFSTKNSANQNVIQITTKTEPVVTRGSKKTEVKIMNRAGKYITGYEGSYALVIGVSNYTHGWTKLPAVKNETLNVKKALEKNGFKVTYFLDPNDQKLKALFEDFIKKYGYNKENRLLFYFSGHGHSRENNSKGYLVPTNAPDPETDSIGFLRTAYTMTDIHSWSKKMESKHALFLFDSCFSGSLFKSKAFPKAPAEINYLTARPVRQYITAGDAGQTVPAKSVFTPFFIRGLRGEADLDKDGYILGTELGIYLRKMVTSYGHKQTPVIGKIRVEGLDEGEFVFKVN